MVGLRSLAGYRSLGARFRESSFAKWGRGQLAGSLIDVCYVLMLDADCAALSGGVRRHCGLLG